MFISLDWISDYVDLTGLDVPTIVNRLTLATAEVEGTKMIRRFVKDVLVGEIKTAEKLTDQLTFCQVDCGSKTYTTVCGAPNVHVGLKAPFAPAGTVLAGNITIEVVEISGKPSQGILCSAAELGMSDWHEILLECPDSIPASTLLEQFIPETDTLIEIDNKSLTHRPDLWGHYGFAREFAAIFQRELKPLPQIDLSQYDSLSEYPLKNEDYENCPCYGCIEFQTKGTIPSPLFIQRRLHALGMRSYNLLVDVTNYVNWEIAQPTHAFDADKLGGIRIATAGSNAQERGDVSPPMVFTTLDGQARKLLPEDLLIWGSAQTTGQYRPVALAGIMGGLETEVTESTVKLLLESANFKASRIRRTASRLDFRTDASQRYEKSQPPSNVKVGIARILKLIEDSGADLHVLSQFTVDGDLQEEVRYIDIPVGRLEQLAGIALSGEKVTQILESLGFELAVSPATPCDSQVERLTVGVPPFRSQKDISIPEDILEEVLRVYGFDNIPPVMPAVPIMPLHVEKHLKMENKIRRVLSTAHQFLEVHNYIWFNENWLETLEYYPGTTLMLKNPTSPETRRLRTTLIPNLLALVPKNRPFRESFRLFEIGRVFCPHQGEECHEMRHLAGVAYQRAGSLEDFYRSVKSAVDDVFTACGFRNIMYQKVIAAGQANWLQTGHLVGIYSGEEWFGQLGILEKGFTTKVCREGGQIVWFESVLNAITNAGTFYPDVTFEEPPRYPLSWQDFSLLWNIDDGFDKLESLLDRFVHPLVIRREFLVSYRGKDLDKGTACYSFRYWIGSTDHTLSGEEIEVFHQQFLTYIKKNNISLRT